MKIRTAVLNDVPSICKLYEEFYAYNASLQPNYYCAVEEKGGYPQSVIKNNKSKIFVAVNEEDTIIGFIHVEENITPPFPSVAAHGYVEVIDFFVTDNYRKKGIGSMLINEAKRWGKSLGLDYIELFALTNAEGAINFYEHEGFELVSQTMRFSL